MRPATWNILPFLLILVAIAQVSCVTTGIFRPTPTETLIPTIAPTPTRFTSRTPQIAIIQGHVFRLEVADTPEKRSRGLMGRTHLPEDAAMLFVYEQEASLVFWMKDTFIPLDILFLDSNRYIVDIQAMEPKPGVSDVALPQYVSQAPAQYAIEMNVGLAARYGFKVGMLVELQ